MSDYRMLNGPDFKRNLDEEKSIFDSLMRAGVKTFTLSFTCNNCGNKWNESFGRLSLFKFLVMGTKCPNCGKKNYVYEIAGTLLSIGIGISLVLHFF